MYIINILNQLVSICAFFSVVICDVSWDCSSFLSFKSLWSQSYLFKVDFQKRCLLQIKVCNVVIHLVAGWFSLWVITL